MADSVILTLDGPDGPREVKLTSPDKELWPGAGMADGAPVTKRDLAGYLVAVAEPFLHINGDRPMTLQRFPEGIEGEEFFAKRPPCTLNWAEVAAGVDIVRK